MVQFRRSDEMSGMSALHLIAAECRRALRAMGCNRRQRTIFAPAAFRTQHHYPCAQDGDL
jgi:hypothetical protein